MGGPDERRSSLVLFGLFCWWCRPNDFGPLQLWTKPQPGGAAAVFINNVGATWGDFPQVVPPQTIKLTDIGGIDATKAFKVRDIWNHADIAHVSGELVTPHIPEGDSLFYLLTPV